MRRQAAAAAAFGAAVVLLLAGGAEGFLRAPAPLTKPLTVTKAPRGPALQQQRQPQPWAVTTAGPCSSSSTATGLWARQQLDQIDVAEEEEQPSFLEQRGTLRPLLTGAVWLGFIAYAFAFAPGKDAASQALDQQLLTDIITDPLAPSVTPLFAMVFNMLGVLPFIYTSLLLPGARDQRPVPAAPFCVGSFALGFFALGPYLALREFRPFPAPPKNRWLRTALESKIPAVLATAGAVALVRHGFFTGGGAELDLAGRLAGYQALFASQTLAHVSSLDFLILNLFVADALREDMLRREWYTPAKALAFSLVPVLGPCLYLVLRPALPQWEEDMEEEEG